ncbi:sugar epimerase [Flavobacterium psychrophilum]|jgi:hypothetical protein|uniref:WxcM-like domain-containing protein n=1 Tax=Flavobacterium psychrophilum TaxID=96345 RepID=A0A4P8PJK9_FLAPS|nr:WxcM-like domain-containing protein [Flavobacterium psychrophilum]AIG30077.1 sugar epimerase [Flavobacterium psychrophilum]AIG32353.1 sugar epimerase [Flavobacterium psychrophilum]AIG34511.1 sugar epimerase [Flavobacterium psychrophilum]AIG36871.1 sugar epimerase [Flavobacterium psychrophilum]AIG39135.1 sugar epimerase [Flavobacterium psychrophilum]
MNPRIIKGNCHTDTRGKLKYNNDFDASQIKRIYCLENANVQLKRGWQGHKIEQRWFSAVSGEFEIKVAKINDWDTLDLNHNPSIFQLSSDTLDYLHIPPGYVTCIQAKDENAILLVMANYFLGEVNDEYRFSLDEF